MLYTPHDYQKYVIDFIKEHPIAAVILDMGMGKTSITLTAIMDLMHTTGDVNKVLVIAPLRVADMVWSAEIEKWDHLSTLRYSKVLGSEKKRIEALNKDADIYLINRDNLPWLVNNSGISFDFDMVVIDELSTFKNSSTKRFKTFMQIRPLVKRIVGLTGTPSPNGIMDLFAEYKVLDMGKRLGKSKIAYLNQYYYPSRVNGRMVYSYNLLPGSAEKIYKKISDITISLKAMDHLQMPDLITTRYTVYMTGTERMLYETMKRDMVLSYLDDDDVTVTAANAAALSQKLCQMANGAVYTDKHTIRHIHDQKLDALEDIIDAANGKSMLVAYWYKHDLVRIINKLKDLKVSYATLTTDANINAWNNKKISVGLIHPASAGHGLNLQKGGSLLVWFGVNWNLELYQQTIARLWRQGQSTSTVVVQHIITGGTIDEIILLRLANKNCTQQALIDAVKAIIKCQ